jgi:hypothetical protein
VIAISLALLLVPLALGAFSSLIFGWQWFIGPPTRLSALFLLLAVVASSIKLFQYLRRRAPPSPPQPLGQWVLFGLAFAFAAYWMLQQGKLFPIGGWDAWSIWNLHARFLYRGVAGMWRELFDGALFWSHNDYPLLLPAVVTGFWTIAGTDAQFIPRILALLFPILAIAILSTATSTFSKDQRGWLAGLILLATPSFLRYSSLQMADIPLATYILTAVVFLRFATLWPQLRSAMLVLAGMASGFAGWTKNEGLLFVLAVLLSQATALAFVSTRRGCLQDLIKISLGLAPILALILGFKAFLAPSGDIPLNGAAIERMTHIERYSRTAVAFVNNAMYFGDVLTVGATNPGLLMVLYLILLYRPPIKNLMVTSLPLLLLPVLMLAGYFTVYIITPNPLQEHLATSLDRLLIQLWPASVFILATAQIAMPTERTGVTTEPAGG